MISRFATASRIGAIPLRTNLEQLAQRARITLSVSLTKAASPADSLGLTPREMEILGQLADGLTDREIVEVLFISKKTASVHVSNVLHKLDLSNRVEAGRVGQAHGLGPHTRTRRRPRSAGAFGLVTRHNWGHATAVVVVDQVGGLDPEHRFARIDAIHRFGRFDALDLQHRVVRVGILGRLVRELRLNHVCGIGPFGHVVAGKPRTDVRRLGAAAALIGGRPIEDSPDH